MSPPWMPLWIADFLGDTSHLDDAETGAYLLLIMHYWAAGSLPDDDKKLARIARSTPRRWVTMRPTIQAFFHDGWKHKRIDAELQQATVKYERRVAAGRAGGIASASVRQSSSRRSTDADSEGAASVNQPQPHLQRKKDAANAANGLFPADPDADYFRRAREVLGKNSGGIAAKLKSAKNGNVALARAALETASTKHDAREYVGRIVAGQDDDAAEWSSGIPGVT